MPRGKKNNKGKKVVEVVGLTRNAPLTDLDQPHHHTITHRVDIVSGVRDQQKSNTCWAVATAVATEAFFNRNRPQDEKLAAGPQELVDHVLLPHEKKKSLPIGRMHRVWDRIKNKGIAQEEHYGYIAGFNRNPIDQDIDNERLLVDGYTEIGRNDVRENELLRVLYHQPVVATLPAYASFSDFRGQGVYLGPSLTEPVPIHEHAVLLMGYGTTPDGIHYFRCMNSEGDEWGDNGYGNIVRSISSGNACIFTGYTYPY